MELCRSTQRVSQSFLSLVFLCLFDSILSVMSASMMDFSFSVRFADAEKNYETTEIIPIMFLIEGIAHAFEIQRFREWLKQ